jgi:hypothetical protein
MRKQITLAASVAQASMITPVTETRTRLVLRLPERGEAI